MLAQCIACKTTTPTDCFFCYHCCGERGHGRWDLIQIGLVTYEVCNRCGFSRKETKTK